MAYQVINGKLRKIKSGQAHGSYQKQVSYYESEKQTKLDTKGRYMGLCNRSACLAPGANWYNQGSLFFYCEDCANMLNYHNRDYVTTLSDQPMCYKVDSIEQANNV